MKVSYGEDLAEYLADEKACRARYGVPMTKLIFRRLNQLLASPTLEAMHNLGRCHELKGDRAGCFAVDLVHPQRMIFKPDDETKEYLEGREIKWPKVRSVEILSIEDYH